jgi:hypothetical protein
MAQARITAAVMVFMGGASATVLNFLKNLVWISGNRIYRLYIKYRNEKTGPTEF